MNINSSRKLNYREVLCCTSLFFILLYPVNPVFAKGEYQSGPEFIEESFSASAEVIPDAKILWLDAERKEVAGKILGHPVRGFRVRYWQHENTTAWILDEIGKEMPITIGVVVTDNKINQVKILTYRETRGGEVRFPAFLKQFTDVALDRDQKLTRHIDGITGATLSVRAVQNVSRLALMYHQFVNES